MCSSDLQNFPQIPEDALKETGVGVPVPQLVCTNYPRWATTVLSNKIYQVSLEYLKPATGTTPPGYFQDAIADRLKLGGSDIAENLLTAYQALKTTNYNTQLDKIRALLKGQWQDLCLNLEDYNILAWRLQLFINSDNEPQAELLYIDAAAQVENIVLSSTMKQVNYTLAGALPPAPPASQASTTKIGRAHV